MRRLPLLSAAVALTTLGMAGAGASSAQAPPEWSALAKYSGALQINPSFYLVDVQCESSQGVSTGKCHPEGTVKVTVSAAARRRLHLSSSVVGRGVLVPRGLALSSAKLTIPAAVKPKLKAAYEKARAKCSCPTPLKLAGGRYSVTLTGPAGMPHETIGGPVEYITPGSGTGWRASWSWTSNFTGPKPGGSGDGSDG